MNESAAPRVTELWVNRKGFRDTKVVEYAPQPLEDGQLRVSIDKMGLTSNNVSYAVSGDMIGYWKYFPAEGDWGKVPGWAMADVVESRSDEIAVGERLWGFFPMASEVVLTVGKVTSDTFMDASSHRCELPALYNQYRRTQGEPDFMKTLENERCLLFPLFMTSFILYDYLLDNELFGARQIIIGSVSSKTGFGLAHLLKQDPEVGAKIVGITSASNVEFVEGLGCCDQILTYGAEDGVDHTLPTAWVDMSGNGALTENLHHLLDDHMVESCIVGATHWDGDRAYAADLPGAPPTFFFTPARVEKRTKDWGPGVLPQKAAMASAGIAAAVKDKLAVEFPSGVQAVAQAWVDLLDNRISPNRGLMISLSPQKSEA